MVGGRGEGKSQYINQILTKSFSIKKNDSFDLEFLELNKKPNWMDKFVDSENLWLFPLPSQPQVSKSETRLTCECRHNETFKVVLVFNCEKKDEENKKKEGYSLGNFDENISNWNFINHIGEDKIENSIDLVLYESKDILEKKSILINQANIISFVNKNDCEITKKMKEKFPQIEALDKIIIYGPFVELLLNYNNKIIPIYLQDVPGIGSIDKTEIKQAEKALEFCDIAAIFCGKRGFDERTIDLLLKACKNRTRVDMGMITITPNWKMEDSNKIKLYLQESMRNKEIEMGKINDINIRNQILTTLSNCYTDTSMYFGKKAIEEDLSFKNSIIQIFDKLQHFTLIPTARDIKRFCTEFCSQSGIFLKKDEKFSKYDERFKYKKEIVGETKKKYKELEGACDTAMHEEWKNRECFFPEMIEFIDKNNCDDGVFIDELSKEITECIIKILCKYFEKAYEILKTCSDFLLNLNETIDSDTITSTFKSIDVYDVGDEDDLNNINQDEMKEKNEEETHLDRTLKNLRDLVEDTKNRIFIFENLSFLPGYNYVNKTKQESWFDLIVNEIRLIVKKNLDEETSMIDICQDLPKISSKPNEKVVILRKYLFDFINKNLIKKEIHQLYSNFSLIKLIAGEILNISDVNISKKRQDVALLRGKLGRSLEKYLTKEKSIDEMIDEVVAESFEEQPVKLSNLNLTTKSSETKDNFNTKMKIETSKNKRIFPTIEIKKENDIFIALVPYELNELIKEYQFVDKDIKNSPMDNLLKKKIMPVCIPTKNNFDYSKKHPSCKIGFANDQESPLIFLFCDSEEYDDYVSQHKNRLEKSKSKIELVFVSIQENERGNGFARSIIIMLMKSLNIPFFWQLNDNIKEFRFFSKGVGWRKCSNKMALLNAQILFSKRASQSKFKKEIKALKACAHECSENFQHIFQTKDIEHLNNPSEMENYLLKNFPKVYQNNNSTSTYKKVINGFKKNVQVIKGSEFLNHLKQLKNLTEEEKAQIYFIFYCLKINFSSLHRDALFGFARNSICSARFNIDPTDNMKGQYKLSTGVYGAVFCNMFAVNSFNYLTDKVLLYSKNELSKEKSKKNTLEKLGFNRVSTNFNKLLLKNERRCFIINTFQLFEYSRNSQNEKRIANHQNCSSKRTPKFIHRIGSPKQEKENNQQLFTEENANSKSSKRKEPSKDKKILKKNKK